jgi:hypothetical protein
VPALITAPDPSPTPAVNRDVLRPGQLDRASQRRLNKARTVLRHSQRWRSSSSPIRRRQLRSPALLWFVKTASALFSVNSFFRSPEKRFRLSPFLGFLRVHPFLPTIGYSKSEGTKKRKKG